MQALTFVNDKSGQRIAHFGHLIDRKSGNWYSERNHERQAVAVKLTQYTPTRAEALRKRNLPGTQMPDMKILWFDTVTADTIESRTYSGSHTHSFFELQLVFAGSCVYECDGETFPLSQGQALLIPSNLPHCYLRCSDSLLKISIAFSLHTAHPVSAALAHAGVQRAEITEAIWEAADYMFSQASREDLFLPGILSGRILEILFALCAQWQIDLSDPHPKAPDPRFLVAKNYIHQNSRQLLSCEAVAQECGYSAKQLSRIFKSHTGKTLYEYITHARIQEAAALLLDNTQSIQQVSFLMGFENESSFVSFFKRHCGVTPGNFRKQKSDQA
jgi:AraC-like DNA-binding protein/mannose-6-phosphate isomerase-like protein (cupin superfamily)